MAKTKQKGTFAEEKIHEDSQFDQSVFDESKHQLTHNKRGHSSNDIDSQIVNEELSRFYEKESSNDRRDPGTDPLAETRYVNGERSINSQNKYEEEKVPSPGSAGNLMPSGLQTSKDIKITNEHEDPDFQESYKSHESHLEDISQKDQISPALSLVNKIECTLKSFNKKF